MSKNLVIVESPAKAKTIEKYLGSDFRVLSSVGHIRKDTKIDPEDNFKVTYEIDPDHKTIVKDLKKAAKESETIWLATDEDREGESISWHLLKVLNLPENTNRITFHEITKTALEEAIKHPRTIDMDMVSSQQARQSLDMIVGYDLSGVIRKKVPGAKSAGRVQSPAVKLVVEKEREIEQFDKTFTFKVTGEFSKDNNIFPAILKTPIKTEKEAEKFLESLKKIEFEVEKIEQSEGTKANPTPLTTAALQIEANSKLGFSTSTTMRAAQALYQAGLITYHRTDSLNLSSQAINSMSDYIKKNFGENYLKIRHFKTKSAGAQEAHEAIRPTDINQVKAGKNTYEQKLYHLIWSRTLATQMANAKIAKNTVTLSKNFIAKGEVVTFDGFLKVYGKNKDLELPNLKIHDRLKTIHITARQAFANPPARYTEGSLVKKLEELGIGRPSTYAGILSAIQNRGYVKKGEGEGRERNIIELKLHNEKIKRSTVKEKSGATKGKLLPTPVGELIADFLTKHFEEIVDYGFTADIEGQLDQIAEQKLDRVKMLKQFYTPFKKLVVLSDGVERFNGSVELGKDPKTNKPIYAKISKNGGFIQLGENAKKKTEGKPRFAPLPKDKTVKTVTLEEALQQLALPSLPRSLGKAKDGTEIFAAAGPFGPFLKAGKYNIQVKQLDPYTMTLEDALPLYQAKIDSIVADWGDVMVINGAYGPYIKGPGLRNHLKIPKEEDPKKITEEEARKRLENKPKSRRRAPRKTASKKSSKKTTKK